MQRLILLLIFTLSFVSCGKNANIWPVQQVSAASVEPATSEEYTYQFSGNRCSTGMQSAPTFAGICEALKDNELNKDCAESKRENLFLSAECSGSFR